MPILFRRSNKDSSKSRRRKMSAPAKDILIIGKNLTTFPFNSTYSRLAKQCVLLDLTQNKIKHLDFLSEFPYLRTLIIDENCLQSVFKCHQLDSLENLSVNKNDISNLPVFLNNLKCFFPNLKWLSMMNNEAAPSYFNGGSKFEHSDYRMYVSYKLPQLMFLDCETITEVERQQGIARYGRRKTDIY
ncbi:leucine-rich melanocyte differentiation-associated protein-like [Convolutriloba macropyga]|uniref:leucine-rich melanocyte differentiation-associated protein-like n=1 Tax=Convolutriloba macropyga TaxID=536237 RepID=UPI003F52473B